MLVLYFKLLPHSQSNPDEYNSCTAKVAHFTVPNFLTCNLVLKFYVHAGSSGLQVLPTAKSKSTK